MGLLMTGSAFLSYTVCHLTASAVGISVNTALTTPLLRALCSSGRMKK